METPRAPAPVDVQAAVGDVRASAQSAQTQPVTTVTFTVNGESVLLENPSPYLSLNEWLRAQQGLTGTKKMCGEGGCGCCVVTVKKVDPSTLKESTISINSVR